MGTNLPAGFFTNKPGPLAGAGLAAMEQDRIAKLEFPGALPPETLTILDGSISPTRAAVVVDTEGGAPADDLTVISTTLSDGTTLHDGMELIIQAKDQSRVVTVKNSAAVNGILTADGKDVVLGTDWWLILRLESGSWRVVNLAQPQKVASKTNLGAMQVGPHLEVTPGGVVDAPLASEAQQGIGRSATTAEVESGVTGENGPAWVTPEEFKAKINPIAAKALGIFNTRLVLTTSNSSWEAPVTGWARVTTISGGGAGGGKGTSAGGLQGGTSSFGTDLSAPGGSGGGSGDQSGGGGGAAGKVAIGYVYLTAGQKVPVVIGAGGTIGTGAPTGPEAGVNGSGFAVGLGAAGAGNGSAISSSSNGRPAGGPGGLNGTGYGGGGGGYGGSYNGSNNPGGVAGDGAACGLPAGTGKGGNGAVIIEYYDQSNEGM